MKKSKLPTIEQVASCGSEGFKRLNPHLKSLAQKLNAASRMPASTPLNTSGQSDTPKAKKRGKKRREMNQTEREFAAMVLREVGLTLQYEAITLRWGEGAGLLSYTPDFVGIQLQSNDSKPFMRLIFFEVKGAHAWQKDIVKFKAARAAFPLFEFQLHEKGPEGWQQTI